MKQEWLDEIKKSIYGLEDTNAYIFGSYAWGEPRNDSDIDILISTDDYSKYNIAEDRLINSNIPKQLDIIWEQNLNNNLLKDKIIKNGKQI